MTSHLHLPFFSFHTKKKSDLNWNFSQEWTSSWTLLFVCWCYIFLIHDKHEKRSDLVRPNMGWPLTMVKGYMVAFGRGTFPQYGHPRQAVSRPDKALVRYLQLHKAQSLILVVSSRSDTTTLNVHRSISPHGLPSVPFINIVFSNSLNSKCKSVVSAHPIDYFFRMIYSSTAQK